jgi:hypothetical protein
VQKKKIGELLTSHFFNKNRKEKSSCNFLNSTTKRNVLVEIVNLFSSKTPCFGEKHTISCYELIKHL